MCMRAQHDLKLFIDEILHRLDLIIEDTLELSAVSVSVISIEYRNFSGSNYRVMTILESSMPASGSFVP